MPAIAVGPLRALPGDPFEELAVEPEEAAGGCGKRIRIESDYLRQLRTGEGHSTGRKKYTEYPSRGPGGPQNDFGRGPEY
jgi:hypothetical protein